MRLTLLFVLAAATIGVGCDCNANCDRDYQRCLEDPDIGALECDIGYNQCIESCNPPLGASPDGGR